MLKSCARSLLLALPLFLSSSAHAMDFMFACAEGVAQATFNIPPQNFSDWLKAPLPKNAQRIGRTDSRRKVLVIGAGASGLAVMSHLEKRGIAYEAIDKGNAIGGLWARASGGPAYNKLILNSSKRTSQFPDFPMTAEYPDYLARDQAAKYLQDYATTRRLAPNIFLRTEALSVQKTPSGTWQVRTKHLDTEAEREYRAVVIASGIFNEQNAIVPEYLKRQAEQAGIPLTHAIHYRDPEAFRGKRVLVVGFGNTGADIAAQLHGVTEETFLSVRRGYWVVPRYVGSTPADEFAESGPQWIPHIVQMLAFHGIQRWTVGHPTRLGLPTPDHGLLQRIPVANTEVVPLLRERKIAVRGDIQSMKNGKVFFHDGSPLGDRIDAIILATGYRRAFPYLDKKYADLENNDFHLPFLTFHPTEPGLFFMPEASVLAGGWPSFYAQGGAIASYLACDARADTSSVPDSLNQFNLRRSNPGIDFKGPLLLDTNEYEVDHQRFIPALNALADYLETP